MTRDADRHVHCPPRALLAVVATLMAVATAAHAQQEPTVTIAPANLAGIRTFLDSAASETGFSGVVLIGLEDDVVLEAAYGFAERDLGVAMRPVHRFRIGSLTKPVTASAVMVAIERGLLGLDTRACTLLPSCPRSWADVTVRDLLTHTSGIADHFGDLGAVPVEETADELRRVLGSLAADEPLQSPAGTEYAYSNFNYVLLGALLEEVTGKPWEAVLQDWIFAPLGLTSMAYDDVYAIMDGRVRGYVRDDALALRNIEYDDHAAYAAGGLLSNAADLFRWSRAVLTAQLFSAALVEASVTPFRDDYGYGWQVRRFFGRTIYNHTGGIDGFSSHLAHYPDDELTIVVLTNVENDPAILWACDVAARLFGWAPVQVSAGELTAQQRCGVEG